MLDMSFSEIAVIGVVALVVLGPERLPKVARTAGHLFGRLQRYVATVKADINREMDTSELAKIKQEVQDAAKSFEQTIQQQASSVEKETSVIGQSINAEISPRDDITAPISTQSAMLLQQEDSLHDAVNATIDAETPVPISVSLRPKVSPEPLPALQVNLDFGIESVRAVKPA